MRGKYFVFSAAATCAFAAIIVLLFHFFPARAPGPLTAKAAPVNAPGVAAPGRLADSGARRQVVPLAFNKPSPPASSTGQGKTATRADAAQERFARWVELYFSAPIAGDKAALLAQGKELAAGRREALAALIQIDPKRALELAAPWKWRAEP